MSFELPASLERDLERYAANAQITPAEAVVKFVQSGLRGKHPKAETLKMSEEDWDELIRLVPGMDIFQRLPDAALQEIAEGSRKLRSQKLKDRAQ